MRANLGRAYPLAVLLAFAACIGLARADVVATQSGLLAGSSQDGVAIFKAIPFAAPPVGLLRWREPQPPAAWSGVRSALNFGPACVQKGMYPDDAPEEPTSEDCLTLNIWTP